MGCSYTKLIFAWFLLLVTLFNQEIQFVKSRPLKITKTKEFQKFQIYSETPKDESNNNRAAIGYRQAAAADVHDESQSSSPIAPSLGSLDGYRPTSPGRSPGAGHSIHN